MIARAAAAGVGLIVNPAIDLDSCRRVLALAERYPNVYAAVGVHPNDCADFDDDTAGAVAQIWRSHPEGRRHRRDRAGLLLEQGRGAINSGGRWGPSWRWLRRLGLPVILHSRSANGDASRQCNADLLQELRGGYQRECAAQRDTDNWVTDA